MRVGQRVADLLAVHGQLVVAGDVGDCFRASLSYLLGVRNGDHMPNPHEPQGQWWYVWDAFLRQMGLAMVHGNPRGPIWGERWIASVPSKNIEGVTHAIVMAHDRVAFDPSPRRRYRRGMSLLGKDVVLGGTRLDVVEARRLGRFVEWQRRHAPSGATR